MTKKPVTTGDHPPVHTLRERIGSQFFLRTAVTKSRKL